MSKLAAKLFEERKPETENYLPLISAVFGDGAFDPSLNDNAEFAIKAQDALCAIGESSAFGMLERYYAEEYFLHGRSKEEIGKTITDNIDLLIEDLETTAVRFLRRPEYSKELAKYIKK